MLSVATPTSDIKRSSIGTRCLHGCAITGGRERNNNSCTYIYNCVLFRYHLILLFWRVSIIPYFPPLLPSWPDLSTFRKQLVAALALHFFLVSFIHSMLSFSPVFPL